jgi:hypothetical protein
MAEREAVQPAESGGAFYDYRSLIRSDREVVADFGWTPASSLAAFLPDYACLRAISRWT